MFAELGLLAPLSDADVNVRVNGNQAQVSDTDLQLEQTQIEDDLDGIDVLATFGIGYRF